MAPLRGTDIGLHDLNLVAKYVASKYDTVAPNESKNVFEINIVVRDGDFEIWPYYTIVSLMFAFLALFVTTIYLFCDKVRQAKNLEREYHPQAIPIPIDKRKLK